MILILLLIIIILIIGYQNELLSESRASGGKARSFFGLSGQSKVNENLRILNEKEKEVLDFMRHHLYGENIKMAQNQHLHLPKQVSSLSPDLVCSQLDINNSTMHNIGKKPLLAQLMDENSSHTCSVSSSCKATQMNTQKNMNMGMEITHSVWASYLPRVMSTNQVSWKIRDNTDLKPMKTKTKTSWRSKRRKKTDANADAGSDADDEDDIRDDELEDLIRSHRDDTDTDTNNNNSNDDTDIDTGGRSYRNSKGDIVHQYLAFAVVLPDHEYSTQLINALSVVSPLYVNITTIIGNIHEFGEFSTQYDVRSFPKLLFFKNGLLKNKFIFPIDKNLILDTTAIATATATAGTDASSSNSSGRESSILSHWKKAFTLLGTNDCEGGTISHNGYNPESLAVMYTRYTHQKPSMIPVPLHRKLDAVAPRLRARARAEEDAGHMSMSNNNDNENGYSNDIISAILLGTNKKQTWKWGGDFSSSSSSRSSFTAKYYNWHSLGFEQPIISSIMKFLGKLQASSSSNSNSSSSSSSSSSYNYNYSDFDFDYLLVFDNLIFFGSIFFVYCGFLGTYTRWWEE